MTLLHGVDGINWQTIDEQVFLRKTPEMRNYQLVLFGDGQHLAVINDTLYAFFCTLAQGSFFCADTTVYFVENYYPGGADGGGYLSNGRLCVRILFCSGWLARQYF